MPGRCCSDLPDPGLADRRLGRRAAAAARCGAAVAGWCFGFGYFVAGLYWIGYAFLVDAKTFGWLLPFAVGRPAGLSRALHGARRWRWRG